MLIKETERTKCSLSESLTSNAIAQHAQARCYRQYSDPLVLKFSFVFVWVIARVVASADFFACGIRFAFLLWSLPCFK